MKLTLRAQGLGLSDLKPRLIFDSLFLFLLQSVQHPDEWPAHYASLCQQYGFQAFAATQAALPAPDHVLVFHTHTKRLIGGEKAYRKELKKKYELECDVSWGMLQSIARESLAKFSSRVSAVRINSLSQPLILVAVGPPGSGCSSLSRRIEKEFAPAGGIIRISSGDLLRRVLQGNPPASLPELSDAEKSAIRLAFATGELVNYRAPHVEGEADQEDLVTRLLKARLSESDIRSSAGFILDGFPRTEAQAQSLRDLEKSLGSVAVFFRFVSPTGALSNEALKERMQARRIDPLTDEIYHTRDCLPPSALIMSRLIRRLGDDFGASSSTSSPQVQLRAYQQNIDHLSPVFKKQLLDFSAEGTQDDLFARAEQVIQPLLERVRENKLIAAEESRKVEEERAREAALRPQTPVSVSINPSPAASAAPSTRVSRKASPAQSPMASPVLTPHTPSVESVAANVVALPLSRRSSLTKPLGSSSSSSSIAAASAAASSSKAGSRRTSATSAAPAALDSKSASSRPASATASNAASKPASRRGSGVKAASPVPPPAVVHAPLIAAPGSRRASLNQNRRSGSMRLSGAGGIPTQALNAQAAPAVDSGVVPRSSVAGGSKPASKPASNAGSKRASGSGSSSTPIVPAVSAVTEKRASGSKPMVPSRPISASSKRASRDVALPVAAAAAAAVDAADAAAEEEVVLVRKSSKRGSKRPSVVAASASGSTSPTLASARATTPPAAEEEAAAAAPADSEAAAAEAESAAEPEAEAAEAETAEAEAVEAEAEAEAAAEEEASPAAAEAEEEEAEAADPAAPESAREEAAEEAEAQAEEEEPAAEEEAAAEEETPAAAEEEAADAEADAEAAGDEEASPAAGEDEAEAAEQAEEAEAAEQADEADADAEAAETEEAEAEAEAALAGQEEEEEEEAEN